MPRYVVVELVEAVREFAITAEDEAHAAAEDGTDIVEASITTHDPIRNVSVTEIAYEAKP